MPKTDNEQHFREIGISIREHEEHIDRALGSAGLLLEKLASKRVELGIAGPHAQDILGRIGGAIHSMIGAREHVSAGHLGLRDFKRLIDAGPRAYGDCCEPSAASAPDLRVVALHQ